MVGLVYDHGGEVGPEPTETLSLLDGLHAGHDHVGVDLVSLGFHHADLHVRVDQGQLVYGLAYELISVHQHQCPPTAPGDELGEDYGLARPRG